MNDMSYEEFIAGGFILYFLWQAFQFFWNIRSKKKEIKNDMDIYVLGMIKGEIIPIEHKIDAFHKRLDYLEKMNIPSKLAEINTGVKNLDNNMKELREDMRALHRGGK